MVPTAGQEALEKITVLTVPGIEPGFLGLPLCCLVTILTLVIDGVIWKGLRAGERNYIFKEVTGYLFIKCTYAI